MKITFMGTSHGIAEKHRYCSSTVVTVDGKHYIIDAGAPILDLLQRYEFAFEDIAGIFITHTHTDHLIGLVAFVDTINTFRQFAHISIPVYVPDLEFYQNMFLFLTGSSEFTDRTPFKQYVSGEFFYDGTVRMTAVPTQHIEHSHAFVMEAEGKSVVFTGDLKADLSDYPEVISNASKPHDLVVMEAAHQKYGEPYVSEILGKSCTKRMLINHIYEKRNPIETVESLNEQIPFPLSVAYDGMTVTL